MLYSRLMTEKRRQLPSATASATEAGTPLPPDQAVRTMQLESLSEFAPLLFGAATLSALVITAMLAGTIMLPTLAGWTILVVAYGWIAVRRIQALSFAAIDSRTLARRPLVESAVLVGLGAAIWMSIPMAAYAGASAGAQIVLAAAMCAMLSAGLAIATTPAAAIAWTATLTVGLAAAIWLARQSLPWALLLLLPIHIGFVLNVVRRVARLSVTQARAIADQLRQAQAVSMLMRDYEEQGTSWLWQTDADNLVGYVSPRIGQLLGKPTAQLVGVPLPAALGGDAGLGRALLAREPFSDIEIQRESGGETRWLSFSGMPVFDSRGGFRGFRGTSSDVTETRSSERRLRQLASIDVLTGLPNRMRIRELLGEALGDARRASRPCAILFLDLDGFKPVNDTFGHPKGDAVLQTVASRLLGEVGDAGIVGRLGGDEFAVVVGDAHSRLQVTELAERLIHKVSQPYVLDNVQVRIGLSIGCAFGPMDGDSVDELLRRADLALYEAKAQGRGTTRFFDPKMQREAEERVRLEHDLRQALALNQFKLLYQPLVDANSQEVVGFEALLRWNHPVRGPVSPALFVPVAEETGLIAEIGEWVLKTACREAATWPAPITVAVNLSSLQLMLPNLVAVVSEALSRSHLPANRLELEVTESVFLHDTDGSLDALKRLRALGVRIALDDFGTGYSSLGYLNRTIFHKLKIDGSFVRVAAARAETVSIIQAIVTLANCFGMTTTAEGVETHDDYVRMRELGCHQIQGYLFGRPLPFEEATELVGTRWSLPQRIAG